MPRYCEQLPPRQERFVQEYIGNGYNATQAALAVYNQTYGAARVTGCRLLTNANVQHAIAAHIHSAGISVEDAVQKHSELINSDNDHVALGALKEYHRVIGAY